jgi:hypothetical protein
MSNWKLTLRNFGIIVVKNAVAAILTNAALMAMLHGAFNVTTTSGWWNIGKAALAVVVSREAAIWVPVLLKWSQTNASPSDLGESLDEAESASKKATAAIEDAKSAAPKQ